MRSTIKWGLILGFYLSTSTASAITILETYQANQNNNATLKAAHETAAAADDAAYRIIANWLPQLSLKGYGYRGHYHLEGTGTRFEDDGVDITGMQTLFDYSKLQSALSIHYVRALAKLRYDIHVQESIEESLKRYMDVLMAKQLLQLALLNQKTIKTALYQAKMANKLHLKMQDVVDYAESDYDNAIADTIKARTYYSDAIAALERLTHQTVRSILPLKSNIILKLPPPPNLTVWVNRALAHNLSLRALRLASEVARRKISIARGKRLPTVKAEGSYTLMQNKGFYSVNGDIIGATHNQNADHIHGYNIGLVASIPIFTGGAITAEINEDEHLYRALTYKVEAFERDIALKTRTDYRLLLADFSKLDAEKQAIRANTDAVRIERLQMQSHKKTLLDVLKVQTQLEASKEAYTKAAFAYLKRYSDLHIDAGELNQYVIMEMNLFLNTKKPIHITNKDRNPVIHFKE